MRGWVLSGLLALLGASAPADARRPDFGPVTAFVDSFVGPAPEDPLPGASLILIQNGRIIYRRNFGTYVGIAPQVPVASASKWLSALVIQRLVEQGRMHWDDTVADYFGSNYPNPDPVKGAITLAQLMSHTSGITVAEAGCLAYASRNMALDDCAKSILGTPLSWAPGTMFAYGANSMQVAGAMAQRATGQGWAKLVASELSGPLGLTRTNYGVNPNGTPFRNPIVSGGARSTLRDYANVVQMVVQGGVFDGAQYLSPEAIAEMQLDQTHGVPVDLDSDPYPTAHGYGYGEWRHAVDCNGNATRVSSTGAFGTSPWVDYDHGIAAVFLAYKQDLPASVSDDLSQLWDLVTDALGGPSSCKG
jgi:CubicO group peptidase (beta-lactamase class C family)